MTKQLNKGKNPLGSRDKQSWQEPKLTFVQPKLTKHGGLSDLTGGNFGSFFPPGGGFPTT